MLYKMYLYNKLCTFATYQLAVILKMVVIWDVNDNTSSSIKKLLYRIVMIAKRNENIYQNKNKTFKNK